MSDKIWFEFYFFSGDNIWFHFYQKVFDSCYFIQLYVITFTLIYISLAFCFV